MAPKIAYLMSRFPHLPETFILREMIALEEYGYEIALYPLIFQQQSVIHAEAQAWLPRVRHIPFVSPQILSANGRVLVQKPAGYARLWGQVIKKNLNSRKFLLRALALFPKAVYAARQMQQEGVAHIHAHYATHPALVAWLIHRLTGISYSVTVHAHDIFVETAMLATKLKEAAFIAAISEYNRTYLAEVVGPWVTEKTHIVHCGIVPDHYEPVPKPDPKERFELISIGSLQPYKGQQHLVDACAQLRERGTPFRCRIIGEGELRLELERQIANARLETQVQLLGSKTQSEVAELLAEAHCYVQPSIITPAGKMEGIPVSLMEALACCLPVVATNLSGVPELVRPQETGSLAPPNDAEALADAIECIYADYEHALQLAENGRQLVLQEFNLQSNVKHLSHLFDQLIFQRLPTLNLNALTVEH